LRACVSSELIALIYWGSALFKILRGGEAGFGGQKTRANRPKPDAF
jgi:hypothetical protein